MSYNMEYMTQVLENGLKQKYSQFKGVLDDLKFYMTRRHEKEEDYMTLRVCYYNTFNIFYTIYHF